MPKEGLSLLGHDDILRYEEILRVTRVAVQLGITKIRITGGEPLVRRGVVNFISSLKTIPELKDISLTTNGILLENFTDTLFQAGVRRINVSLDSLNPGKYSRITRGGDLLTVQRGIKSAQQKGFFPIKINTVAIRGFNDDEILDFARMTLENPYHVRFIELMQMGLAGSWKEGSYLATGVILEQIRQYYRLDAINSTRDGSAGPAQYYRIRGGMGEIGFISPVSQHICRLCNRLRLTADGHLRACLLSDEEVDLKTTIRNGCSDDDIKTMLCKAIAKKPLKHSKVQDKFSRRKCIRGMSTIGG
jgi:cyclic pyranopterin phosphate synthase